MHGRFPRGATHAELPRLNVQLREILRAVLRAYVERQPTKRIVRAAWKHRRAQHGRGEPLTAIFAPIPAPARQKKKKRA